MKLRTIFAMPLIFLLISACGTKTGEDSIEEWKYEIIETEKEFVNMVAKEGISKAFLAFAADDAVLMRNNALIIGKKAIKANFANQGFEARNISLTWEPDYVDVSSSGDLGYTYGKFIYTTKDSVGKSNKNKGVFHTVWKRQADGKWKFVWD